MQPMLVVLESPYAGNIATHIQYAQRAMHDCLVNRREYPIASHLLYPQPHILDDQIPHQRQLGIQAGLAWAQYAQQTVVYVDYGISPGTQQGIDDAIAHNRPVTYRYIKRNPMKYLQYVLEFATVLTAIAMTALTVWSLLSHQHPLVTFVAAVLALTSGFMSVLDLRNRLQGK